MSYNIDSALKAQQWERCKGELRALVALQGSYAAMSDEQNTMRWKELDGATEGFISHIEEHGLAE